MTNTRPEHLQAPEVRVQPATGVVTRHSRVDVVEPCSEHWETMVGNDRERHCDACGKSVHHLSEMSASDVAVLLDSQPLGGLCIRYRRDERGDPVLSADAPPPSLSERQSRGVRTLVRRGSVIAAGLLTMLSMTDAAAEPPAAEGPELTYDLHVMGLYRPNRPEPEASQQRATSQPVRFDWAVMPSNCRISTQRFCAELEVPTRYAQPRSEKD